MLQDKMMLSINDAYYGSNDFESRQKFLVHKHFSEEGKSRNAYHLAVMYLNGIGTKRNYKAAFENIKASGQKDSPHALCMMGYMSLYGLGTKKNKSNAKKYLTESLRQGLSYAAMHIVHAYKEGDFGDLIKLAEEYHKKEAKKGGIDSSACLGIIYYECGEYERAIPLLKQGAKEDMVARVYFVKSFNDGHNKDITAQHALDVLNSWEDGTRTFSKEFYLYSILSALYIYTFSQDVNFDEDRLRRYISLLLEEKYELDVLYYYLATLYLNGKKGFQKDYNKALDYFKKSYKLGNENALPQIATAYYWLIKELKEVPYYVSRNQDVQLYMLSLKYRVKNLNCEWACKKLVAIYLHSSPTEKLSPLPNYKKAQIYLDLLKQMGSESYKALLEEWNIKCQR